MIYYKYLDIDYNPIANRLKNYLLENPKLIEKGQGNWRVATDWILENFPEIKDLFPWEIEFIGIFVSHSSNGSIHIDNDEKPVRINFPILNCENTITKYYKFNGETTFTTQANGVSYNNIQSEDITFVDSFELKQAVLMRVLEPHQVCVEHDNFPRVSCTIQFKENLEHLLES